MQHHDERVKELFAIQCRRLTDLLHVTHRPYIPTPTLQESETLTADPDTRTSKVNAKVLRWNPYFENYVHQARQILGLPEQDFRIDQVIGDAV